ECAGSWNLSRWVGDLPPMSSEYRSHLDPDCVPADDEALERDRGLNLCRESFRAVRIRRGTKRVEGTWWQPRRHFAFVGRAVFLQAKRCHQALRIEGLVGEGDDELGDAIG